MKPHYLLYSLFCFLFISCGEDRREEYAEQTAADRWIESVMRENYYWYEDMPARKGLNFFTDPTEFFGKLLSDKDGKNGRKYSRIDDLSKAETRSLSQPENSYGFQFKVGAIGGQASYVGVILYVVPNSPASEAGLKRGDIIHKVNNENLTSTNYEILLGGKAALFSIGKYDEEKKEIVPVKDVEIAASRPVEDNPVHYYSVYKTLTGDVVGYLVYNHFTAGRGDNKEDKTYDNMLRELSLWYKSHNVSHFILDLRYNPGGQTKTAELLCTILAPESELGKKLGYLKWNDKRSEKDEDLLLNPDYLAGGSNLNLKTIYVLTTTDTASASELLIYCLSPYMTVTKIGQLTEGKNVGSVEYINSEQQLRMQPITCQVYNSEGNSDYSGGIKPDHELQEALLNLLPFGDIKEPMLNKALTLIAGQGEQRTISNNGGTFNVEYNSLKRKSLPGVIVGSDRSVQY